MPNEYPKNVFAYDEQGERVSVLVSSEEEIPTGYVSIDELGPAPARKAAPAPMSGQEASTAAKRLVAAESENARLKDTVKLYEDFVARLSADENCPPALQAAIRELTGDAEAAPNAAKPASKRKPRST